jgi:Glycosyl hydrolases family 43
MNSKTANPTRYSLLRAKARSAFRTWKQHLRTAKRESYERLGEAIRFPGWFAMAPRWRKWHGNPVLGGELGTLFDMAVLRDGGKYRMWASWRPRQSIGLFESTDGVEWISCGVVFGPTGRRSWEQETNRPSVVKQGGRYHLWYTGQTPGYSVIGYATSTDGVIWRRMSNQPVLSAESPWEKASVMCPHVIWEEEQGLFRMWYSGGEQSEPDAIGYAVSADGVVWKKHPLNPIFVARPSCRWEKSRVTAMHVLQDRGLHYGFYIGFADGFEKSCIGVARSKDGVTSWERYPRNPILKPGPRRAWDGCNIYKPYVIHNQGTWMLWYNASRRCDRAEQIGLATCADWSF